MNSDHPHNLNQTPDQHIGQPVDSFESTNPASLNEDANIDSSLPGILFTAFEPSGDDHSAAVIRELKRRHPGLPIYAWGGPKMRLAGAQIIQETGKDAVMGIPGIKKILEHRQINKDIAAWLDRNPQVKLHIPVDSPAANFPVCSIAKKRGLKVVHLVAPQMWAWGPWRVKKLKRLSDRVLCLLPFEPAFFGDHGVQATFIGHPLFDEPLDLETLSMQAGERLPSGSPKITLLPGSRPGELRRNFPLILSVFRQLREEYPQATGVVAATTEEVREQLYANANTMGGWPEGLDTVVGETDLAIRWCDVALVVSGTVTLQVAKQARPMVIVYKLNKLKFRLLGWLLSPPFFALPNLVAGRMVVPELIPYFSGTERLRRAASAVLGDTTDQESMRLGLQAVAAKFDGKRASSQAADAIEDVAGITPTDKVVPSSSTAPAPVR